MTDDAQPLIDDEHLKLLRLGYLISAAWNVFWALFPLMYVAMGLFIFTTVPAQDARNQPDPRHFGIFFAAVGAAISAIMAGVAVLKFLTARAIGRRRSRMLCMVTAAISCFALPYGTALGVATFLVLSRPSVRDRFAEHEPPNAA
jgi:hypothetical protein